MIGSRRLIYHEPTLGVANGFDANSPSSQPTAPVEGWQSG